MYYFSRSLLRVSGHGCEMTLRFMASQTTITYGRYRQNAARGHVSATGQYDSSLFRWVHPRFAKTSAASQASVETTLNCSCKLSSACSTVVETCIGNRPAPVNGCSPAVAKPHSQRGAVCGPDKMGKSRFALCEHG